MKKVAEEKSPKTKKKSIQVTEDTGDSLETVKVVEENRPEVAKVREEKKIMGSRA